jgi:hypothetical protein
VTCRQSERYRGQCNNLSDLFHFAPPSMFIVAVQKEPGMDRSDKWASTKPGCNKNLFPT